MNRPSSPPRSGSRRSRESVCGQGGARVNSRLGFGVRIVTALLLAWAVVSTLSLVHGFGQQRFFTIDEYQYGHATWLVAEGERPYLDFYEHHFPLSYALHAPIVSEDGSFAERALQLRSIAFGYLLAMAATLLVSSWWVTRNPFLAALSACLPLAFGFGLMSSIDYRADNFAACLFVICLALLEVNRERPRRSLAVASGLCFAAAVFMTQKLVFLGGGAVVALLAWDLGLRHFGRGRRKPCIGRPVAFVATAAAFAAVALAFGAALGILGSAFEATVLHTLEHEAYYPRVHFWRYAAPFFAETRFTTLPILAFAAAYVFLERDPFWLAPLAVATLAGAMMQTQYPYNFVYTGFLILICAVRGFAAVVERLRPPAGLGAAFWSVLYLVPLGILSDQLAFVANTSTNQHQLALLTKIEDYSSADDAVIDGSGGALFRKHGSYYWYHGSAHRRMFRDYFENQLVRDYRDSRALFFIRDLRQRKLPEVVTQYFSDHYVHVDGDLYVLGFETAASTSDTAPRDLELIRSGDYFVHVAVPSARGRLVTATAVGEPTALRIDGREISGGRIHLEEGVHRVSVQPGAPVYIVSPLPAEAFERQIPPRRTHTPLFEYDPRHRKRPGAVGR
jgi:hypothetical protein